MELCKIVPLWPISEYTKYKDLALNSFGSYNPDSPDFDVFFAYCNKLTAQEWEHVCSSINTTAAFLGSVDDAVESFNLNIFEGNLIGAATVISNLVHQTGPERGSERCVRNADIMRYKLLTSNNINRPEDDFDVFQEIAKYGAMHCRNNYIVQTFFLNPNKPTPVFLLDTHKTPELLFA